jgi:hypothetical protein
MNGKSAQNFDSRLLLFALVPVNLHVLRRSTRRHNIRPGISIQVGNLQIFAGHSIVIHPRTLPFVPDHLEKFDAHVPVLILSTPADNYLVLALLKKISDAHGVSVGQRGVDYPPFPCIAAGRSINGDIRAVHRLDRGDETICFRGTAFQLRPRFPASHNAFPKANFSRAGEAFLTTSKPGFLP